MKVTKNICTLLIFILILSGCSNTSSEDVENEISTDDTGNIDEDLGPAQELDQRSIDQEPEGITIDNESEIQKEETNSTGITNQLATSDTEIFTVNSEVIIDGKTNFTSIQDIQKLDGTQFDLYENRSYIGTYTCGVVSGPFEGEYEVQFDSYTFNEESLIIGVPSNSKMVFYEKRISTNRERFSSYIDEFLNENGISNMTYNIDQIFQLPEFGNDLYLVKASDDQRNYFDSTYYHWKDEDYVNNEMGFFDVLLLIDLNAQTYQILEQRILQSTPNIGVTEFKIVEVGEFNKKQGLDILLNVDGYDYYEYLVVDTEEQVKE